LVSQNTFITSNSEARATNLLEFTPAPVEAAVADEAELREKKKNQQKW